MVCQTYGFATGWPSLAAQCEIPPHIAQYPFEIVSQRGVSHAFALIGYRASIAEIPLLRGGGVIAPPLRLLSKGAKAQKRGRGLSHPIGHIETP